MCEELVSYWLSEGAAEMLRKVVEAKRPLNENESVDLLKVGNTEVVVYNGWAEGWRINIPRSSLEGMVELDLRPIYSLLQEIKLAPEGREINNVYVFTAAEAARHPLCQIAYQPLGTALP